MMNLKDFRISEDITKNMLFWHTDYVDDSHENHIIINKNKKMKLTHMCSTDQCAEN